jgi:hypothetical protein
MQLQYFVEPEGSLQSSLGRQLHLIGLRFKPRSVLAHTREDLHCELPAFAISHSERFEIFTAASMKMSSGL